MRRWMLCGLALFGGMMINVGLEQLAARRARAEAETPPTPAAATLDQLAAGKLPIVDLTWPLNAQSAYWPGENYRPFELHTIATLEKDGVLSKAFASPEHLGTHLDAPSHFEAHAASVDQINPRELFAPGVVIDVQAAVAGNPDYLVSLEDIRRFEAQHGPIPVGAVVLAHTGWGKFWNQPARYQGQDVMSRLHFPGFSPEAVDWLIEQRHVRGVGIDTLSVDHGPSRDFPVHHLLGRAGRYGLENLAHLEKLPARGFVLVVAPIKIETGSGGPTRVLAIVPPAGAAH